MRKVLITGFNGFVGRHACRMFREKGFEIHGITDKPVDDEALKIIDRVTVCNLAEPEETAKLDIDSDSVLNLAGFATNSSTEAQLVDRVNVGVHTNLYRRIQELGLSPRIIAVSSGLVYDPSQKMPINENGLIRNPDLARPYEASKVRMEQALEPFLESGMDIVIARPFNHIGPGQGRGFIVPDFAFQIENFISTGEAIQTGSLDTKRDYSGVEAVVNRYLALIQAPNHRYNIYNICSGLPVSGMTILKLLCSEYGIDVPEHSETESMQRPGEIAEFYGSCQRIIDEFGSQDTKSVPEIIHNYVKWRRSIST